MSLLSKSRRAATGRKRVRREGNTSGISFIPTMAKKNVTKRTGSATINDLTSDVCYLSRKVKIQKTG